MPVFICTKSQCGLAFHGSFAPSEAILSAVENEALWHRIVPAQHCLRHWSGFLIDPLPELPLGPARPAPDLQPEGSEAHPGEQQPQLAQRSHEEEAEAVGPEIEGEKLEADLSSVKLSGVTGFDFAA